MSNGRPSKYTPELAAKIIARMCEGESLRSICRDATMPVISTVMLWVATDREGFSEQYAKGCEARAHYWADEMLDIADDGANDYMQREGKEYVNGEAIARSRLRVDTRKWLLSKMLPKYADKPITETVETLGPVIEFVRATRTD
jgi:hypothetical protein